MNNKSNTSEELLARAYALSNDEETKILYRDWAATYDKTMLEGLTYQTPEKTARLLASVIQNKSALILDVGAGTGLAGQNLAELGFMNIDALDYSSDMLGVAKARLHDGNPVYQNCIQADLNTALQLKANSYDAIICTGLFTHAHVGAGCLPELFRVLKPNSFFAATVHKDIWKEGGFGAQVSKLEESAVLRMHSKKMDIYFKTDEEPQGYYILWESLK